jgi:hypothetical protein
VVFGLLVGLSHTLTNSTVPLQPLILAYIGPDQFLPLTSILGAIAGLLLMFWNRVVGFAGRVFRGREQSPGDSKDEKPSQTESL